MKYLITGANGFLGKHLCKYLEAHKLNYLATVRSNPVKNQVTTGDLNTFVDWPILFNGIDVVIHTAAKAHVMAKTKEHLELLNQSYIKLNFELTKNLALAAKTNKVKRFIFISTIKVNGEFTSDTPFKADDIPNPSDAYSISKHLAEQELLKLHEPGVFEVVIIRPCLIYGLGVKANFENLIKLVKKQIPLPFGSIQNKRSLLSVSNLSELILLCATHPKASGQIFLAADDQFLSLGEMIVKIARAFNLKARIFHFPVSFLNFTALLLGKKQYANRLFGNLQVDINKTKNILNWQPKYQIDSTPLK